MGNFLVDVAELWEDLDPYEMRGNVTIDEAVFHAMESAPDSAMFHRTSKEVYWLVDEGTDDAVDDAVDRTLRSAEETEEDPLHPALQDFLRVVGCDPMNNTKAYYAMSEAVCWAMGRAVNGSVNETVSDAVYLAVNEAVHADDAARLAVSEDISHPALQDFLKEVET